MIVCPNCNHQNPDGATQCEACYTPLPATTSCPNCGAAVQVDASFCGQCGFQLNASEATAENGPDAPDSPSSAPDLVAPDPLVEPDPLPVGAASPEPQGHPEASPKPASPLPATIVSQPGNSQQGSNGNLPESETAPPPSEPVTSGGATASPDPEASASPPTPPPAPAPSGTQTQLQLQSAHLLHLQTNTKLELPSHLSVIHIGKPNDQIPPDIDVSGFPHSEIVSRTHADIRVEGDIYYLEDVGSSNGTYINHSPLPKGNRHRLRAGDRISLGKGDKVTFLFQSS